MVKWLHRADIEFYGGCMKRRQLNDVGAYVIAFHVSNYVKELNALIKYTNQVLAI
jgi:hypothetical protein